MANKITTLIFLRRGDEVLLAMKKRGFGVGRWNGVGGKVEPGETVEQAVARECQEEIRVTPVSFHKVAEHDFVLNSGLADEWHSYCHAYICDNWEGEPTETDEMAPRWFSLTDIPYDDMWSDDRYWLPQVLDGKLLKTYFTFDRDEQMLGQDITEVTEL